MIKKPLSMKSIPFVLIAIVVCGLSGYFAFNKVASILQVNKLITFAQNLDYKTEAHLVQYKTCWDIFPASCGQVLYYTTSLNREEFQGKIDLLASAKELPQNVDGYGIFGINLPTNYILTINGMRDSVDRTYIPEPLAYKWRFTEGGEKWVITFYEVANDGHVYKLDDQQIVGNIVTIMLQTK